MKKNFKNNSQKHQQEKIIEKALRTGGFIFPETVDEVKEFERIFGSTDVIIPDELKVPNFLSSASPLNLSPKISTIKSDNFAIAAREGTKEELPEFIKKRMEEGRKKADAIRKRLK